ncbi:MULTISPECIES: hypothetical protein [Halobacteriales]|uniref:Membrane transport protein MMPL domain-containing protein n=2 Tax=Halobacteriales TaxID=2235 RepID=A0A1I0QYR7_9EURY|nr:hypothetical protein [Natrinema salifodinae]SEW32923.1 hypothetical protein SAMN05216285_4171 [Natrinema salifodinae]
MVDIVKEAQTQIANAIGTGSPEEQIIGSVVLAAFVIMTSSIGLVGTLILVPVVLLFAFLGFLRLIPAVDDRWPL